MKLKKYLMMVIVLLGFCFLEVKADGVPSTITLKSKSSMYYYSEDDGTDYISGYNFYRKELKDGTYVYCASNIDTKAPAGKTLSLAYENKDMGLNYLIQNGYPNKSMTGNDKKDYYITQSAIWEYFDVTRGSNNWNKTTFDSSSTGLKKYVYLLVQGALNAKNSTYPEPEITLNYSSNKMTKSDNYFVSVPVSVSLVNTTGTYDVVLKDAPQGSNIKKDDNGNFQVYVPVLKGDNSGSITVSITAKGIIKKTYIYTTGSSSYQDIIPQSYEEEKVVSKDITFYYESKTTKVKISKQDITSKEELAGAELIIKDKDNKEVSRWVSTTEPHYIEGLEPGDYTLTEVVAPDGYVLSKETIKFTVKDDGTTTTAVMYNTKTKVKISKQDITSKEELPGAELVVKDKNDKEIDKWLSTTEPHYIEGLKPGDYTLTEVVAPDGYVLSKETVKFTVKNDGTTTEVVMYNSKTTITKISKQDITSKEELAGAELVVKDKNDNEIDRWVSTTEPHYIEGLEPGDYTLTEVVAPDGYVLSKETVKFTVKDDGTTTEVVMYNTLYEVPITDLNVNKTMIIIALSLIMLGTGMVVYYAKFSK